MCRVNTRKYVLHPASVLALGFYLTSFVITHGTGFLRHICPRRARGLFRIFTDRKKQHAGFWEYFEVMTNTCFDTIEDEVYCLGFLIWFCWKIFFEIWEETLISWEVVFHYKSILKKNEQAPESILTLLQTHVLIQWWIKFIVMTFSSDFIQKYFWDLQRKLIFKYVILKYSILNSSKRVSANILRLWIHIFCYNSS